jgi:hypothetical protein
MTTTSEQIESHAAVVADLKQARALLAISEREKEQFRRALEKVRAHAAAHGPLVLESIAVEALSSVPPPADETASLRAQVATLTASLEHVREVLVYVSAPTVSRILHGLLIRVESDLEALAPPAAPKPEKCQRCGHHGNSHVGGDGECNESRCDCPAYAYHSEAYAPKPDAEAKCGAKRDDGIGPCHREPGHDGAHLTRAGGVPTAFHLPAEPVASPTPAAPDVCQICGYVMPTGTLFVGTGTGIAHRGCFDLRAELDKARKEGARLSSDLASAQFETRAARNEAEILAAELDNAKAELEREQKDHRFTVTRYSRDNRALTQTLEEVKAERDAIAEKVRVKDEALDVALKCHLRLPGDVTSALVRARALDIKAVAP